jgi:hypothetical protein
VQNGPGEQRRPYIDKSGMFFVFRTVEMEPAIQHCDIEDLMTQVDSCFTQGVPAVISTHSINFHSTIKDYRTPTLKLLDEFLAAMERRWPDLLYVNDADLFSIATQGVYTGNAGQISVGVRAVGAKS